MKKHYKIIVIGLVQGVNFRKYAKQQADLFNLTGEVMNAPDGSVHIHVEGEKKLLDDYLIWCKKGSPLSSVKEVTFQESEPVGYTDFTIKHFDF